MSFDDWLLALHLLAAFALVAATILFWVVLIGLRRSDLPEQVASTGRLAPVGGVVVVIGSLGVVILGIWLAIALDGVQVWDGWVIAAIVLWAIGSEAGRRGERELAPCLARARELVAAGQTGADADLQALARSSRGLWLQLVSTGAILLILIDMIWKPGA